MKPVTSVIAAGTVALIGTVAAQQAQTPEEQGREGLPATQHQEEAVREIGSDLFQRLDENHDGSISRQEAEGESGLSASWSEYDENGDDALDQQEFSAYDASSAGEAEQAEHDVEVAEGGPTVEGLPASPHQREAVRGELVQLLDKDGDGGISQSEAQGESDLIEQWDQLDRNADGKLDATELGEVEE